MSTLPTSSTTETYDEYYKYYDQEEEEDINEEFYNEEFSDEYYEDLDEDFFEDQSHVEEVFEQVSRLNYTNMYRGFVEASQVDDLSDILNFILLEEAQINKYGFLLEDMLLSCSFNEKTCNASEFKKTLNPRYGACYTFNSGNKVSWDRFAPIFIYKT